MSRNDPPSELLPEHGPYESTKSDRATPLAPDSVDGDEDEEEIETVSLASRMFYACHQS